MIDKTVKEFDKVYNKLTTTIDIKIKDIFKLRDIGYKIDYNKVKLLNLYVRYLESVKDSKYKYFYVDGLNNISNYLNKI